MGAIRTIVLVAVLAISTSAWAANPTNIRQPEAVPASKVLTLTDCINLAIRNQAAIRQAQADIQSQTGAVERARSGLLPNTSVSTSTILSGNSRPKNTIISTGASQLIYDFGRTNYGVSEAKRLKSASQAGFVGTTADVILNVKQNYYHVLATKHLVDVMEANVKSKEAQLDLTTAKKDAGLAPLSDVLNAQTSAANARVNLVNARNTADQANVALNAAMGVDTRTPVQIADVAEPELPIPDQNQAVDIAMARRPEVRRDMLKMEAADAAVKIAKTGNLPAISASVSRSDVLAEDSSSNTWGFFLNLDWTPIDFGNTSGSIKQAQAALVSAQETLYDTKQTVSQEVIDARLNLLAAAESLTASQVAVKSAEENLAAASGRYQAGVGILTEVIDAQTSLLTAQVNLLSAQYDLSTARAELEHALGEAPNEGRP